MDKQIKISKFFITAKGDESVGIFPQIWTLEPDFYFENETDLDDFKERILQAFEWAFDDELSIETAEEIAAQEELHILMTEQMLDDFDNDFDGDHCPRKMRDDD